MHSALKIRFIVCKSYESCSVFVRYQVLCLLFKSVSMRRLDDYLLSVFCLWLWTVFVKLDTLYVVRNHNFMVSQKIIADIILIFLCYFVFTQH